MKPDAFIKLVQADNLKDVQDILEMDPEAAIRRDAHEGYPLEFATGADMVKLLIQSGADVHAHCSGGGTPLHRTSANGHLKAARKIINNRAYLDARDDQGRTPLHEAARTGRGDIVRLLLERHAQPELLDSDGASPLHLAAAANDEGAVDALSDWGLSPHIRDAKGVFPFEYASEDPIVHRLRSAHENAMDEMRMDGEPAPNIATRHSLVRDGTVFAVIGKEQLFRRDETEEHWVQTQLTAITDLQLSPDGKTLLVVGNRHEGHYKSVLEFYDARDLRFIRRLYQSIESLHMKHLRFSPAGTRALVTNGQKKFALLNLDDGRILALRDIGYYTWDIASAPTSSRFAAGISVPDGPNDFSSDRVESIAIYDIDSSPDFLIANAIHISQHNTQKSDFIDEPLQLEFVGEDRLVLYQTTTQRRENKPVGWRGDLVIHNPVKKHRKFHIPLDAKVHGDERNLEEAGFDGGCRTRFAAAGRDVLIAMPGKIVLRINVDSGRVDRVALPEQLGGAPRPEIKRIISDPSTGEFWGVPEFGRPVKIPLTEK